MIVILPYCKADYKDAFKCISSLVRMSRLAERAGIPVEGGHSLVLMPTEHIPMEDEEMLVSLSRCCPEFESVESKQLKIRRDWPYVVNWAFWEAMKILHEAEGCMLWCEPDVTFVGYHPLDRLEAAFERNGMDMMGTLAFRAELGLTINGVAVYGGAAPRIFSDVNLTNCDSEFDIGLRHRYLHRAAGTDLIGQVARTRQLTDVREITILELLDFDKVLWHGYKDGCLFDRIAGTDLISHRTDQPDEEE